MPGIAKINDIGIGTCPCHQTPVSYTTIFVTGASSVLTNGLPQATIGSVGIASCGHPTVALTGSGAVFAESSGVHRIGDVGENCGPYTVVTGSGNVISN